MADAPELIVRAEEDAWESLRRILGGEVFLESHRQLRLEGWPKLSVYVPERRLDSALTPYMMEGFIDFQRAIYRTHALLVHGEANARLLSEYEKVQLELIVKVGTGSSDSDADLIDVLLEIAAAAVNKMDPTDIVITILGLGVIWAGQSSFRAWLDRRKDETIAQTQSKQVNDALSALKFSQEQDLERMKLLAAAYDKTPPLSAASDQAEEARLSLTRHSSRSQTVRINGVEVPGHVAERLTRSGRAETVEKRLDGLYRILRVDTTSPEGFRVRLEDVETGVAFDAGVQDALLSEEQRQALQEGEWQKVPVYAKINVRQRRDEIVEAVVIDAQPRPDGEGPEAEEVPQRPAN